MVYANRDRKLYFASLPNRTVAEEYEYVKIQNLCSKQCKRMLARGIKIVNTRAIPVVVLPTIDVALPPVEIKGYVAFVVVMPPLTPIILPVQLPATLPLYPAINLPLVTAGMTDVEMYNVMYVNYKYGNKKDKDLYQQFYIRLKRKTGKYPTYPMK